MNSLPVRSAFSLRVPEGGSHTPPKTAPAPLVCGNCGQVFTRGPLPEGGEFTRCSFGCDEVFWHYAEDGFVVCGVVEH